MYSNEKIISRIIFIMNYGLKTKYKSTSEWIKLSFSRKFIKSNPNQFPEKTTLLKLKKPLTLKKIFKNIISYREIKYSVNYYTPPKPRENFNISLP